LTEKSRSALALQPDFCVIGPGAIARGGGAAKLKQFF
jgi:hypothetical protein